MNQDIIDLIDLNVRESTRVEGESGWCCFRSVDSCCPNKIYLYIESCFNPFGSDDFVVEVWNQSKVSLGMWPRLDQDEMRYLWRRLFRDCLYSGGTKYGF